MDKHFEKIMKRNFPKISEEYKTFCIEKYNCRKCSVYDHYQSVCLSEGNAKDPIFMFIGEAPGKEESEKVRPFIGQSGQRLRLELRKYPKIFRRDTTIITNVLSCRPNNNKFDQVSNSDINKCRSTWLFREIALLKPKVIVTLGNTPLEHIGTNDCGITACRGKWSFLHRFKAWSFPTYHPSYVIRSQNTNKQFVVDQFMADIETISKAYKTMLSDYRLHLNNDKYKRFNAMQKVVELGLT